MENSIFYPAKQYGSKLFLTFRGDETAAGDRLKLAARRDGYWPAYSRHGNYYSIMERMRACGLVEVRHTGPRGGRRFHATRKGRYWLKKYA